MPGVGKNKRSDEFLSAVRMHRESIEFCGEQTCICFCGFERSGRRLPRSLGMKVIREPVKFLLHLPHCQIEH